VELGCGCSRVDLTFERTATLAAITVTHTHHAHLQEENHSRIYLATSLRIFTCQIYLLRKFQNFHL
jgi:hypothetical protein